MRLSVVARWSGFCTRTLRRWIERGILAGDKIGAYWYVERDDALRLRSGRAPKGRPERVREE